MTKKTIRCAIYTRKSTEEGLEQNFNSLDAQREAGEAFIKSQKHEGWEIIQTKYDDGGYSGGTMERPGLKKLLSDISAGKIDTIIVYKIDRLTRALNDFAKMVEIFDKHNVSFVSVTQQFNTTTSMGRLTLNVLLSFAQFEREVTGERIRDKVNASKKKGMWMGGCVPLGYKLVDKKLIIEPEEAKIVQYIYDRFININETLFELADNLKANGYKHKSWTSKNGNAYTGKDFNRSNLSYILSNPIYIGKIKHKDKIYDGEHKAIISQEVWDNAQAKIERPEWKKNKRSFDDRAKLLGKIFDYQGNRMSPTYSYKYSENGRYKMRYYLNREICKSGKTSSEFKRIRADYIDKAIKDEVIKIIDNKLSEVTASKNPELISEKLKLLHDYRSEPISFLTKVVLFPDHIELHLSDGGKTNMQAQYKRFSGKMCITPDGKNVDIEKEYFHPDDKTFAFVAKGFYWSKLLQEGTYKTIDQISKAQNHSKPYIKRALRQRYLAPDIINKILNPKSEQIDIERLISVNDWCWGKQKLLSAGLISGLF